MLAGAAATAAYGVHQMTPSHGHGGHNVSDGAHNMMVPMVAALANKKLLGIRDEFIDSYQQFTKMMCEFLEEFILGFNKILNKVDAEAEEKYKRRMASEKKKIKAIKRARRPKRVDPDDDENEDL
nr:protein TIC 56, chloroplastic [Tanacetum cinerariifolium]